MVSFLKVLSAVCNQCLEAIGVSSSELSTDLCAVVEQGVFMCSVLPSGLWWHGRAYETWPQASPRPFQTGLEANGSLCYNLLRCFQCFILCCLRVTTVVTVALSSHIVLEPAPDSDNVLLSALWLCPQSPAGCGQLWLAFLLPVIWC